MPTAGLFVMDLACLRRRSLRRLTADLHGTWWHHQQYA